MAAFVQEAEPVLLSPVVIKHLQGADGLGSHRTGKETKVESFQPWKIALGASTMPICCQTQKSYLRGAQRSCVSVSSSIKWTLGFPGGSVVKNPPVVQDTLGREDPLQTEWQPTPVFLPGGSHGQRSLAGYSLWEHKELDTTERLNNNKTKMGLSGASLLGQ